LTKVAADECSLEGIEVLNCLQDAAMHLNEVVPALNYMTRQDWKIAGLNQKLVERNGQITNLNQELTERNGLIASLNQKLVERNGQITNLNQELVERNGQITNLNHELTERNGLIASLNRAVVERDGQIANLQERENELQVLSNQLRNEVEDIHLSTSWRITKPLRKIRSGVHGHGGAASISCPIFSLPADCFVAFTQSLLRSMVILSRRRGPLCYLEFSIG